jgi:thiamine biosynthesis lipoprotein ApbE/Na+-translocating ferredoxin:NAD+ oxidoreductase RnfG subunit
MWRLAALASAAWLLHVAAQHDKLQSRKTSVSLPEAQRFFPNAIRISPADEDLGGDAVYDSAGRRLGFILTTSPEADSIVGYVGANNVLVALDLNGQITGAELLSSDDTADHVAPIKTDEKFWKKFRGWKPAQETPPKIDAVAGSTLTSLGIEESIQKRFSGHATSLRFPEQLTLKEIQNFFPDAKSFSDDQSKKGWSRVADGSGKFLGFIMRTSPQADYVKGYSGPTESLVAIAPDGQKILGLRLRKSFDTDEYVNIVRDDAEYLHQLASFTVEEWARMDLKKSGLEGVSGATETSFAVAEGLHKSFAAHAAQPAKRKWNFQPRDDALLGIILGAIAISFSRLRGKRVVRFFWQAILIGAFGLWCGDLLSIALLAGWSQNGIAWRTAPALLLLAAVALLVPWTTRRQIYCYQLCPHGAVQEWLGKFRKFHIRISPRWQKRLRLFPGILLIAAFALALIFPHFELAHLEPFDAWALRGAVLISGIIAVVGLIASLFVPMAYCHFGCPTGALLKFVRSSGGADYFGKRDFVALIVLVAGTILTFAPTIRSFGAKTVKANSELHGSAFGTTWNVQFHSAPKNSVALQKQLADELERIESTLSNWRTNSATSEFNNAQTTQPIEMPAELVNLVARALQISRASGGAYDITVAPLVNAWGFGPVGTLPNAPSDEEIARLRTFTGWKKLIANTNDHTLQKLNPQLQVDLGSILQGYGADCLAKILKRENETNCLIEVGGELLALGKWRVAIENPAEENQPLKVLELKNEALATSGTYRASHGDGKKHWSHLINPSTGKPVNHPTTLASVLNPSCAAADAWATTLLVTGGEKAKALAETNDLQAVFLTGGKIVPTKSFPSDSR